MPTSLPPGDMAVRFIYLPSIATNHLESERENDTLSESASIIKSTHTFDR